LPFKAIKIRRQDYLVKEQITPEESEAHSDSNNLRLVQLEVTTAEFASIEKVSLPSYSGKKYSKTLRSRYGPADHRQEVRNFLRLSVVCVSANSIGKEAVEAEAVGSELEIVSSEAY